MSAGNVSPEYVPMARFPAGHQKIERTWDGEPLWSVETQQDELFAGDAFQQMPGQLPIEEPAHHHRDCDGYRLEHRVVIDRQRTSSAHTPFLYRAVCEERGPLGIGSHGSEQNAKSEGIGHSHEIPCDGRCRDWS